MELMSKIRGWLRRPSTYLGAEWNRMAPRERKLVAGAVGGVVVAVILLIGFLTVDSLRSIAESNADAREALAAIAKHRDEYLEAKARMVAQEVRIGNEPPQLAADLEAAAREVSIQIPETSGDQPTRPAGKRYVEHNVDVTLKQVDLLSLSKFLAKLETGRRLIVVTHLGIRRRFTEGEKMDVQVTATAFERVKEEKVRRRGPTPAGAAKGKT